MNYSLLDKLTIIIFTYNRHKLLKRTIGYWLNYNVKLVILDGSDTKLVDPCLNSKNIKYIYDTRGLYERLATSMNHVDTEFVILGCDDEFYLPSGLCSCIRFLTKEPDFSSCGGRALGFANNKNKLLGIQAYPNLKDLCLDQNLAFDRIYNHFSIYVPAHFYSVIRSSKYENIIKHAFEKKYNMYGICELHLEFLVLVSGKSKIIPQLLWMRNKDVPQIADGLPQISEKKWWFDKHYEDEKLDFIKRMKTACDEISTDQNSKLSENEIAILIELFISRPVFKKNPLKRIVNFFQIRKKMLTKFILGRDQIRFNSIIDKAKALESQEVLVNYEELNKIISIIQNSKNQG